MRWFVYVLVAGLALWAGSFATRTGVLYFSDLYMLSDAHGFEFDPTTGATDTPVGRLCFYLTYAGPWQLALIERNDWSEILHSREGRTDPELEGIVLIDSWPESDCPAAHSFSNETVS